MCVPGCLDKIKARLLAERAEVDSDSTRRRFLRGAAAAALAGAGGLAAAGCAPRLRETMPFGVGHLGRKHSFDRIVDLTHTLSPRFPTYFGEPGLEVENLYNFAESGFNLHMWHLNEHSGTHLDAPLHFSADGRSADEVPLEDLALPLAVMDIRAKSEVHSDAQLTPEDIKGWETIHGEIPQGACVAMLSGWDQFATGGKFRNADAGGKMHFPGFHLEAAQMLMEEREVRGIAVDTLSLDYGPSADFAVHYAWLPSNRWGMECVANLAELPPRGAMLIAGVPKIKNATGGPARLFALV